MTVNPYEIVNLFERHLAEFCGSKYCVTTDSGSSAIFLSIQYRKYQGVKIGGVRIPAYTYPSVPCSIIHSGGSVRFYHEPWHGQYELNPLRVWDAALRFKRGMYTKDLSLMGGLQCLSFHAKKILAIGRGGAILTDDEQAYNWLKKARFDGRSPVPLQEDNFEMLGWNCYMTPEQAARGIQLLSLLSNQKNIPDLDTDEQRYANLSKFKIYK